MFKQSRVQITKTVQRSANGHFTHGTNKALGTSSAGSTGSADGEGLSGSQPVSLVLQRSYKAELGRTKVLLRGNVVGHFDDEIFTLFHDLDKTMTSKEIALATANVSGLRIRL